MSTIIWGAGLWGKKIYDAAKQYGNEIVAYCDANEEKWGTTLNGVKVISIDEARGLCEHGKADAIVIAVKNEGLRENIMEAIDNSFPKGIKIERADRVFDCAFEKALKDAHEEMRYGWNVELKDALVTWTDNLLSEVESWVTTAVNLDSTLHYKYDSYRKRHYFEIEGRKELPVEVKEDNIVMDIGCGLFSRYGEYLHDEKRIRLVPVDALAYFYNLINSRKICEDRKDYVCNFGLFEFMGSIYGENMADLIIIGNALDHCIDPYRSLVECLYVLKNGGVMRLIHARAEGLYENWEGLHKWNIDYEGDNLIFWNNDNAINVTEALRDKADIELYTYMEKEEDFDREYITVDITKKEKIDLAKYYDPTQDATLLLSVIERLMGVWSGDSETLHRFFSSIRMN